MGRVKLQIKKLELSNNKQVTFSKRRVGLQKKAQEIAVLCDVDILLVLFSPSGKLSWCSGNSSAEQVIVRFASLSPQERAKRKSEVLEHLKRLLKKSDHELNLEEFLQQRSNQPSSEDLHQHLQMLRQQLSHTQQRLSMHNNFETIKEGEELERRLKEKLLGLRSAKEEMLRWHCQQLIPFGQTSRATMFPVQKGMQMNSGLPNTNILQMQSWTMDEEANNIPSCSSRDVNGPSVSSNVSHDELIHGGVTYEQLYRHRLCESNLTLQQCRSDHEEKRDPDYMTMPPSSSNSQGHPAMPFRYWHPNSNLSPPSHAEHNQVAVEEMNEEARSQILVNQTHLQQYLEGIRSANSSRVRQNPNNIGETARWQNNFTPLSVSLSHLQENDNRNDSHNHNHNHDHGL